MTSLHFAPSVPVFDANVCVGDGFKEASPCRTRADLLAEMDAFGVGRALVYHAQTEVMSPLMGNQLLEDWIADDGRLVPQWSAMPTEDSLAQLQSLYDQRRVSCMRLHDSQSAGLPFRTWAYEQLLSWLTDTGTPLWIPLPETDPDDVVTTLRSYPGLVSVLVGAHYTHALWVRPMLRALPNAYLELSRYEPIGEVEALRNEFGAGRLVYGSWYPRYALGSMLYYLHHTYLTSDELALVCAGNLERILRGEGRSD